MIVSVGRRFSHVNTATEDPSEEHDKIRKRGALCKLLSGNTRVAPLKCQFVPLSKLGCDRIRTDGT